MSSISQTNFIAQYLRPVLASSSDYSDAILGYWIAQALYDISRSFPRKTYALWTVTAGTQYYAYSDSSTVADENTIIRILNAMYPWTDPEDTGDVLTRKSHLDTDFYGGDYYDPDNDAQVIYVGPTLKTGSKLYADSHITWTVVSSNIINPPEHYHLIVLFCVWMAFQQQMSDAASSAIVDTSLINSLALETKRAEVAYRTAYQTLDEAKATSGIAKGWSMDKWDTRAGA